MKGGSQSGLSRGLNLPGRVRRELQQVGIFARGEVGLEHQHFAGRYVIRGVESGGAIREMGHYVTFSGEDGEPLSYLHPIDAIGVNGVHAVVVAPWGFPFSPIRLIFVEVFSVSISLSLVVSAA